MPSIVVTRPSVRSTGLSSPRPVRALPDASANIADAVTEVKMMAHGIGHVANYLAAAAVIAVGGWMLIAGASEDEEEKASRILTSRGLGRSPASFTSRLELSALTCIASTRRSGLRPAATCIGYSPASGPVPAAGAQEQARPRPSLTAGTLSALPLLLRASTPAAKLHARIPS